MCYNTLYQLQYGGTDDIGKKKFPQKQLADQPQFKEVMRLIDALKLGTSSRSVVHPKMERLRALLVDYFTNQQDGPESNGTTVATSKQNESKVMVFASYRSAVEEIITELDKERPLIRAHKFIGQAASKGEGKGLTQKQQLEVSVPIQKPALLVR